MEQPFLIRLTPQGGELTLDKIKNAEKRAIQSQVKFIERLFALAG
jgi:hypothetical protein